MENFTSKKMILGVKSDIVIFYIMEKFDERNANVVGGKVSPT